MKDSKELAVEADACPEPSHAVWIQMDALVSILAKLEEIAENTKPESDEPIFIINQKQPTR